MASGRYGLALAARLLGLAGRRVAVPGYVCPAVLTGLHAASVKVVPIDCAPGSIRFDAAALSAAVVDGRIDGVLAANSYGIDQDFGLLARLDLPVIEDAAYQAGRGPGAGAGCCGTRGHAGVWSFNFKALSALGGGVVLARSHADVPLARGVRWTVRDALLFASYVSRSVGRHRIPRFFSDLPAPSAPDTLRDAWTTLRPGSMSQPQAAVALAQWRRRDTLARRQAANAAAILGAIERSAVFAPLDGSGASTASHFVPVVLTAGSGGQAAASVSVRRLFHEVGVQVEPAYPVVLGSPNQLPNAWTLAGRLLLLPCNATLGRRQIERIVSAVDAVSRRVGYRVGLPARASAAC